MTDSIGAIPDNISIGSGNPPPSSGVKRGIKTGKRRSKTNGIINGNRRSNGNNSGRMMGSIGVILENRSSGNENPSPNNDANIGIKSGKRRGKTNGIIRGNKGSNGNIRGIMMGNNGVIPDNRSVGNGNPPPSSDAKRGSKIRRRIGKTNGFIKGNRSNDNKIGMTKSIGIIPNNRPSGNGNLTPSSGAKRGRESGRRRGITNRSIKGKRRSDGNNKIGMRMGSIGIIPDNRSIGNGIPVANSGATRGIVRSNGNSIGIKIKPGNGPIIGSNGNNRINEISKKGNKDIRVSNRRGGMIAPIPGSNDNNTDCVLLNSGISSNIPKILGNINGNSINKGVKIGSNGNNIGISKGIKGIRRNGNNGNNPLIPAKGDAVT